jgi:hypothetical protein
MKKIIHIILLFLFPIISYTQDIIIRNSGDTIKCKIKKVETNDIFFEIMKDNNPVVTFLPRSEIKSYVFDRFKDEKSVIPQSNNDGSYDAITDQNSSMIAWGLGFQNMNELNKLTVSFSYNYFVARNAFFGLATSIERVWNSEQSETLMGIGPQVGFTLNSENSSIIPFVIGGIKFLSLSASVDVSGYSNSASKSGSIMNLGGGFIIPLKPNIGMTMEFEYNYYSISSLTQSAYLFNIGMVFLLH